MNITKYEESWQNYRKRCQFFDELVANEARYSDCAFVDVFNRYHCQFIAYEIFKNEGYEEVINSGLISYLDPELRPCEGGDHQCSMDCYTKGICKYV